MTTDKHEDARVLSRGMLERARDAVTRANPNLATFSTKISGYAMDHIGTHGLPGTVDKVLALREDVTGRLGRSVGLAVPGAGEGVHKALDSIGMGVLANKGVAESTRERAQSMLTAVSQVGGAERRAPDPAGVAKSYPDLLRAPSGTEPSPTAGPSVGTYPTVRQRLSQAVGDNQAPVFELGQPSL